MTFILPALNYDPLYPPLSSISSRELHGNTDCGITVVTAVKPRQWGTGFHFHRGSGSNGDSYLEISIDYCVKTVVISVMETGSVVSLR